jgi:quercetin dioxygenase-like cupin family protein
MNRFRKLMFTVGLAVAGAVLGGGLIGATPSTGVSMLIGRATFADPFKVKRVDKGLDWKVEVKAEPNLDVAVQQIDFAPGTDSGWHSHPGPVFISVVQGTMTFYESTDPDCEPTVRHAGEGFLDVGDHAHIARNETGTPAKNIVVYLVPPGKALRIDEPNPGNCAFRGF